LLALPFGVYLSYAKPSSFVGKLEKLERIMTLTEQIKQVMGREPYNGAELQCHNIIRQLTDIVRVQHEALEVFNYEGSTKDTPELARVLLNALALSTPIVKEIV
jgi:hypothetical protein